METPKEIMTQKIQEAIVEFNNKTGACPTEIHIKNINETYNKYIDDKAIDFDIEYEMI